MATGITEATVTTEAMVTTDAATRAGTASPANQDQVELREIVLETFPPAGSCAIVPLLIAPLE